MPQHIAFIGAGNMSSALYGGLIHSGYSATDITATSPEPQILEAQQKKYGIHTTTDNLLAATKADVLVLAVKPQILKHVCIEIASVIQNRKTPPLIISIAAGVDCSAIQTWLKTNVAIVRCMPNTPALIGVGASGLYANHQVTSQQKSLAETLFKAVGMVEWVDNEDLLNAVTAVSGSAPAYFFLMLEAMQQTAMKQGLSSEAARNLAQQTALGAAKMATESPLSLSTLMQNVMSPQGSTEQAIFSLQGDHFSQIIERAMNACMERAQTMQNEFGV